MSFQRCYAGGCGFSFIEDIRYLYTLVTSSTNKRLGQNNKVMSSQKLPKSLMSTSLLYYTTNLHQKKKSPRGEAADTSDDSVPLKMDLIISQNQDPTQAADISRWEWSRTDCRTRLYKV